MGSQSPTSSVVAYQVIHFHDLLQEKLVIKMIF